MRQVAIMIGGWGEEVFNVIDETQTKVRLMHPIDPQTWSDIDWVDKSWLIPIPTNYQYLDLSGMIKDQLKYGK